MNINIRLIYLYLFAFVGLLVSVIGCIRLVELGLKVYVFPGSDRFGYYAPPPTGEGVPAIPEAELKRQEAEQKRFQEEESGRQRQRDAAGAIAMIAVGVPLYAYHWRTIQKEHKRSK